MTIGEQLKDLRISSGLTQSEVAAGVISTSYYSKVENDEQSIDRSKLVELLEKHYFNANAFGFRIFYNIKTTKLTTVRMTLERMTNLPNRKDLDSFSKIIKDNKSSYRKMLDMS